DTQFANMYLAYEALSDEQKREYADLQVVHSWEANRRNTGNKPASEEERRERPPVTHPLIRTHPETGRKTLYLGVHTSHIEGREEEGRKMLEDLQAFATQDEFVYSHQWRVGDLAMWDNRCLLHRAIANYGMSTERRILHRTVIKGVDVPH
ncbi:MAG: TauD/TfdA family dioxygenase, partial [Alphaproteobacteria bacterium]|nr:TauD/TfdA family dioxygenase [Alphaproteobacteria bacterium]